MESALNGLGEIWWDSLDFPPAYSLNSIYVWFIQKYKVIHTHVPVFFKPFDGDISLPYAFLLLKGDAAFGLGNGGLGELSIVGILKAPPPIGGGSGGGGGPVKEWYCSLSLT